MSTFKQYFTESYNMKSAVSVLNLTRLDIEDILIAHRNAGYTHTTAESNSYLAAAFVRYDKKHGFIYNVAWEDQDADEEAPFAINEFYVTFSEEGKVVAESSGMPHKEGLTEKEARAELKK